MPSSVSGQHKFKSGSAIPALNLAPANKAKRVVTCRAFRLVPPFVSLHRSPGFGAQ